MTLEEAISREEALAYSFGERYKRLGEPVGDLMKLEQEHRQLAELLRELKDYREREFCRYCKERDTIIFDEPCKSCKIHFVRKR